MWTSVNEGVLVYLLESGLVETANPIDLTRALRRAVMARVQRHLGLRATLSAFFSGHRRDGSPAQTEVTPHLTFAWDPDRARFLMISPHIIAQRSANNAEIRHIRDLHRAMDGFRELRAGPAGYLTLQRASIDTETDPLFAAVQVWESVTPYQVTRHAKKTGADEALVADIFRECRRRGLPEPVVTTRDIHGVPGLGLVGGARLSFRVPVRGPIVLGKSRHFGGGLFRAVDPDRQSGS